MDLPTFRELLSTRGQRALADAAGLAPTEAGFLAAFEKHRKRYAPQLAKAALETVLLRERARGKHARADRLYFTRESLEVSSSEAVSHYRASRFRAYPAVLDLCCGAGIDAIHLALAGCSVAAVDADPLRLAMAEANAQAYGVAERIHFHEADVLAMALLGADAAFVDPSRRAGERRHLDPDRYLPPLGSVLARLPAGIAIGAKIAPGVARADVEQYDAEVEFISSGGELKECVLWFGSLKSAAKRATVLPGPHSLTSVPFAPIPPATELREFVFDPDPAVIRADLLGPLAELLDAVPVDPGVAFLTGTNPTASPFTDWYRVEYAAPFHIGKLRDYLKTRQIGRVTILKRAVELDPNDVLRKLKLDGAEHRHLILTRSLGRTVAIVAQENAPGR